MRLIFVFLFSALASGSFAQSGNSSGEMRDVISQYMADEGSLSRKYTLTQSTEYYDRFAAFYSEWQHKLAALDFESMGQAGKVDYVLLRNYIDRDEYALRQQREIYVSAKQALKFEEKLRVVIMQRRRGVALDPVKTAGIFNDLKKEIQVNQKELEKLPLFSRQQSKTATRAVKEYHDAVKDLILFYNEYDPAFTYYVKAPASDLDSALSTYRIFLQNRKTSDPLPADGSDIIGNPIGRNGIIKSLGEEFIPYTPEELMALANKEFAWCEQEILKASAEMGFGKNWKEAQEKVKNDHVAPGKQPELIEFLAEEATDYVIKNDMVTVPPLARETWRMSMMSPERQRYNPFFLGGEEIQISYPTSTMSEDDKRMSFRGNNKHFSRATVFHELIPGHHLQGFMTDRYNSHRQLFYTPFWVEGWALYWEMILWDRNFQKSPENRVGMLFWRMHRCARILFSLNYHMGNWTPQQCVDFLVEKVGHERANAEGEVRRSFMGGYGPLYQLAYMIGAKQFYALRKELVDTGKMKEKDFHDAILKGGPISVELVRASLTNQPLTRDFKTSWKFGF